MPAYSFLLASCSSKIMWPTQMQQWVFFNSFVAKYMVDICKYSKQWKRMDIFYLLNSNLLIISHSFQTVFLVCQVWDEAQEFAFRTSFQWCCFRDRALKIRHYGFQFAFLLQFHHSFLSIRVLLVFKHWLILTDYFYIISIISTDLGSEGGREIVACAQLQPWKLNFPKINLKG